MKKAKLRVTRISDTELIEHATVTKHTLTENAAKFPRSAKLLAELDGVLASCAAATQAVVAGKQELKARVSAKNASRKSLERVWRRVGDWVDIEAKGDEELIHAAGMRATNDRRPVYMTKVQNFTLRPGLDEGQLIARWKPVRRAAGYIVQVCTDETKGPKNWKNHTDSTKAQCELNHTLVSGQKVWVRVRAFGTRGAGAWSNPLRQTVP